MNTAQIKLSLVFFIFAIIGFGPVSPGCLIGMYIVLRRPLWFKRLIDAMYSGKPVTSALVKVGLLRFKCLVVLITLFIIDILPYPVTPTIAFPIILLRPEWFFSLVQGIYQDVLE